MELEICLYTTLSTICPDLDLKQQPPCLGTITTNTVNKY